MTAKLLLKTLPMLEFVRPFLRRDATMPPPALTNPANRAS